MSVVSNDLEIDDALGFADWAVSIINEMDNWNALLADKEFKKIDPLR